MPLYKNCGWWKNFDCIFKFSMKGYIRNTINLSCAKILLPSVIKRMQLLSLHTPTSPRIHNAYNALLYIFVWDHIQNM
jgi:hypothetical protein